MRYRSLIVLLGLALPLVLSGCGPFLLFAGGTATALVVQDRRSAGTQVEDKTIEFKAFDILHQPDSELGQANKDGRSHINVTSYNNVVLLSGEVDQPQLRQSAEDAIRNIEGVRFVHNELVVATTSSLGSRSNDTWITTKAKASLFEIQDPPSFNPARVKVVTERGVVYLFGLVTPQEGDAVTSTVRRLSGVQQVVKLFEYI